MVKNGHQSHDFIRNHALTLRQHHDNDVSTRIDHFDFKTEFYAENNDRKILDRIYISAHYVPQN